MRALKCNVFVVRGYKHGRSTAVGVRGEASNKRGKFKALGHSFHSSHMLAAVVVLLYK